MNILEELCISGFGGGYLDYQFLKTLVNNFKLLDHEVDYDEIFEGLKDDNIYPDFRIILADTMRDMLNQIATDFSSYKRGEEVQKFIERYDNLFFNYTDSWFNLEVLDKLKYESFKEDLDLEKFYDELYQEVTELIDSDKEVIGD